MTFGPRHDNATQPARHVLLCGIRCQHRNPAPRLKFSEPRRLLAHQCVKERIPSPCLTRPCTVAVHLLTHAFLASCVRRHSEFSVRKSAIPDFIQFFEAAECCHAPGMTLVASDAQRPRPRRAYDHRLREHVVRCGPMAVAKQVHIPRSTVSTWRRRGLRPVVTTEMFDNKQDALDSSARWEKRARVLAAVVRLLLALLRASGFTLDGVRLPQGKAKAGILRAAFLWPPSCTSPGSNRGATTPGGEPKRRASLLTVRRARAQAPANSRVTRWPR